MKKAEQMKLHIETCQSSGKSVTEYCSANGISKANYYYWHKKMQRERASGSSFLQIALPAFKPGSDSVVRIHYPNGVIIELNNLANIALLKELVCCI